MNLAAITKKGAGTSLSGEWDRAYMATTARAGSILEFFVLTGVFVWIGGEAVSLGITATHAVIG